MIIIRLMGGLGNQMFQYALGLALARHNNSQFVVDDSILLNRKNLNNTSVIRDLDLDIFNLDYNLSFNGKVTIAKPFLVRLINKILPYSFKSYMVEKYFHYDKSINFLKRNNIILEGYWQSFKYFDLYKNDVIDSFTFKKEYINERDPFLDKIENTNSVCINIRRGDFLKDNLLGFKDLDYFRKAIELLESKISSDLHFFIFSDDIAWCKANMDFLNNSTLVDHSHKGFKFANYLFLMTKCKHFIIPNSTFAWWAAWLSINKNKIIISPEKWFNDLQINTSDLIPDNWYRV